MKPLLLLACLLAPAARAATPVAGSVVSSKEWRVKRGANTEEEFIGDVRYRSGPTIFNADWALFQHADQSWQAKGHVKVNDLMDDGDTLTILGDQAAFSQRSEKGRLTGKDGVSFTRAPRAGEPDHGHAERMEWEGRNRAAAVGQIHLWGPRLEAWADRADYNKVNGELKFTGGRPVLLKLEGFDAESADWVGALQGDTVTAYQSPRRLSADGKARGWLEFKQGGTGGTR